MNVDLPSSDELRWTRLNTNIVVSYALSTRALLEGWIGTRVSLAARGPNAGAISEKTCGLKGHERGGRPGTQGYTKQQRDGPFSEGSFACGCTVVEGISDTIVRQSGLSITRQPPVLAPTPDGRSGGRSAQVLAWWAVRIGLLWAVWARLKHLQRQVDYSRPPSYPPGTDHHALTRHPSSHATATDNS